MVRKQRILLVVAADKRELAAVTGVSPFERVSGPLRWAALGQFGSTPALLVANGAGRERAAEAARWALHAFDPTALISTGFVGATRPGWQVGDPVAVDRLRQSGESLEYAVKLPVFLADVCPRRGTLLTIDRVAQTPGEKQGLAATGADVVDMEASAVARVARESGIAFYCVRAVSDTASACLPIDFNRALRPDGSFSVASVVWQAGPRRKRWQALLELRKSADFAAQTIANVLHSCQFPS